MDTPTPVGTADVQPDTPGVLTAREAVPLPTSVVKPNDGRASDVDTLDSFDAATEIGKARNQIKELQANLVGSRFEVEAAKAGVDISALQPYLNMGAFVTDDGSPDVYKIQDFISSLGATAGKPEFTQDVFAGDGRSGGYRGPRTDRPESFRGMTKNQIKEFAKHNR